jgi:hypothetical protein
MATETAVGSGTPGSYGTEEMRSVTGVGETYIFTIEVPLDGKLRYFRARHVREGATASSYTSVVSVLPGQILSPPPPVDVPEIDVSSYAEDSLVIVDGSAELSEFAKPSGSKDQFLTWNQTLDVVEWSEMGASAHDLTDHDDVTISSPVLGEYLRKSGGDWVNASLDVADSSPGPDDAFFVTRSGSADWDSIAESDLPSHAHGASLITPGTFQAGSWAFAATSTITIDGNLVLDAYGLFDVGETGGTWVCGGSTTSTGAAILAYGTSHPSYASDFVVLADGVDKLRWDDDADEWQVGGGAFVFTDVAPDILLDGKTGRLMLGGGDTTSDGGNIVLYGSTHPTLAGDIRLRGGGTDRLVWDESDSQWEITAAVDHSGTAFALCSNGGTATIGEDGPTGGAGILTLYGDGVGDGGGTINLYAGDAVDSPDYFRIRAHGDGGSTSDFQIQEGTSDILAYDSSDNVWWFSPVPGSAELVLTSTYLRPNATGGLDLGHTSYRWANLWVTDATVGGDLTVGDRLTVGGQMVSPEYVTTKTADFDVDWDEGNAHHYEVTSAAGGAIDIDVDHISNSHVVGGAPYVFVVQNTTGASLNITWTGIDVWPAGEPPDPDDDDGVFVSCIELDGLMYGFGTTFVHPA